VLVVGLTGGLGAGKTLAGSFFAERGAVVLDADEVARALLEPDAVGYPAVVGTFGAGILDPGGRIDRARLASLAFASGGDARRLDAILHPLVADTLRSRLDDLAASPSPPSVVVVEVPLLVESPEVRSLCGLIVSLDAPEGVRMARARARGMDADDAARRCGLQASDSERAAIADAVVDNSGSAEALRAALERFWDREVAPRVA